MKEIFDMLMASLKVNATVLILLAVLAYFLKLFIEKSMDNGFKARERRAQEESKRREGEKEEIIRRVEEIGKASLDVKKGMRGEEREELVALRVAVEEWEYFLQTAVFDFSMVGPAKADVRTLYEKDKSLFLAVRVGVVRASTYLRNRELEQQLMSAILKIRNVYYPLIGAVVPNLIDLQAQLKMIDNKLKAFEMSGMKDMSVAPTQQDREENLRLQTAMTSEVATFRDNFLAQYRSIAEQMYDVKEAINVYVYRPIKDTDIDKE